jgi:hypothetical protein
MHSKRGSLTHGSRHESHRTRDSWMVCRPLQMTSFDFFNEMRLPSILELSKVVVDRPKGTERENKSGNKC